MVQQQQQQQRVCLLSEISIHLRLPSRFVERGRRDVEAHAAFACVRRSRVIIRVVGFYLLYFCGFARRRKVVVVYYVLPSCCYYE